MKETKREARKNGEDEWLTKGIKNNMTIKS